MRSPTFQAQQLSKRQEYIQAEPYESTEDYPDPAMIKDGKIDALFIFWIIVVFIIFVVLVANWWKK